MKVTRIAYSHRLNAGKYIALVEQARRLGRVRSQVWQRYGSVNGAPLGDRQIRDQWLAAGFHEQFGVLANAWKETLRDAVADIKACREAAKVKVRRTIARQVTDDAERKPLWVQSVLKHPVGLEDTTSRSPPPKSTWYRNTWRSFRATAERLHIGLTRQG